MLKCEPDVLSLDSIKAVSEHLTERIELDSVYESPSSSECRTPPFYTDSIPESSDLDGISHKSKSIKFPKHKIDVLNSDRNDKDKNMNSPNLMFRSMFFMNDEARHFLAPTLPIPPIDSDYFRGKDTASTSTASGMAAATSSAISLQTKQSQSVQTSPPKQRPHPCHECGKTFLMKHHLSTHMRIHTGERPHVCPECGKSFALKHCLSTHLLLHSGDRPYKCPECSKTFTLKHHLVSHERVHSRDRPFECLECGQRFPQKRHLTTHSKFHSGERPFSCQVCGESFSREEHLVEHSRFHGGQRPYNCPDCGAGFMRKFELVNHERSHGRNPESCPSCGKEFLQKRTLLVHIRTCGISSPPGVSSHASSRPGEQLKTCKECGETFATCEGLALHHRLHVGDHSFLTDICSLAATLKQAASPHVPPPTPPKKPHQCADCGRGFSQKHGLFQHRQRNADGSCKLKPFACEKCGKSFSQKNHLALHERQHADMLPSLGLERRVAAGVGTGPMQHPLEQQRHPPQPPDSVPLMNHHLSQPPPPNSHIQNLASIHTARQQSHSSME